KEKYLIHSKNMGRCRRQPHTAKTRSFFVPLRIRVSRENGAKLGKRNKNRANRTLHGHFGRLAQGSTIKKSSLKRKILDPQ
ncbi:MAG: hypothetical protein AAFP98_13240, partial [Pseudomonadota bacterium]